MLRSYLEDESKFEKKELKNLGESEGDHPVFQYTDKNTKEVWIGKYKKEEKEDPRFEVTTQEIHRLLIPTQPEYRFILDDKTQVPIGVISNRVKGDQVSEKIISNVLSGDTTNLATIQVVALFTCDTDLRWGNLFTSSDSTGLKKIDGGWGFSNLKFDHIKSRITEHHLDSLPYAYRDKNGFFPWNWLPLVEFSKSKDRSTPLELFKALYRDSKFQNEKFSAMLKILLFSPSFIKQFIESVQGNDELHLANQLNKTRMDFELAIINNENFKKYVEESGEAIKNRFIADLKAFKIVNKPLLLSEEIFQEIEDYFQKVKKICNHQELVSEEKHQEKKLSDAIDKSNDSADFAEIRNEREVTIALYENKLENITNEIIESNIYESKTQDALKKIVTTAFGEPFDKISLIIKEITNIVEKTQAFDNAESKRFISEIFALILTGQYINANKHGSDVNKILNTLDALMISASRSALLFKDRQSEVFKLCQNIREDQFLSSMKLSKSF